MSTAPERVLPRISAAWKVPPQCSIDVIRFIRKKHYLFLTPHPHPKTAIVWSTAIQFNLNKRAHAPCDGFGQAYEIEQVRWDKARIYLTYALLEYLNLFYWRPNIAIENWLSMRSERRTPSITVVTAALGHLYIAWEPQCQSRYQEIRFIHEKKWQNTTKMEIYGW